MEEVLMKKGKFDAGGQGVTGQGSSILGGGQRGISPSQVEMKNVT